MTHGDKVIDETVFVVQGRRSLRNHILSLVDGREVLNVVGDDAFNHFAIRRLEETILVGARISRQRIDQADIRAFRRLDRTNPAVVSRVHVAHFKARALSGQATRAQCRYTALVGDFRQRVVLIHEL